MGVQYSSLLESVSLSCAEHEVRKKTQRALTTPAKLMLSLSSLSQRIILCATCLLRHAATEGSQRRRALLTRGRIFHSPRCASTFWRERCSGGRETGQRLCTQKRGVRGPRPSTTIRNGALHRSPRTLSAEIERTRACFTISHVAEESNVLGCFPSTYVHRRYRLRYGTRHACSHTNTCASRNPGLLHTVQ